MHILDDKVKQNILDTEDMYHKIIHLPEHVIKAYKEAIPHKPDNFAKLDLTEIKRVVICGMGGSAISGDIAKAAFSEILPVEVIKDYKIPFIDENTLVCILSYSGNTEETLSCLQQALGSTKFVGVVTSGGRAEEVADGKFLWMELPGGYPPRSAIGYLFFTLLKLLENFDVIPNQVKVVNATIASLIKKAGAITRNNSFEHNIAKNAAAKIQGKIPIIYSSNPRLGALAYRWKCQINENAKYPAFWHTFPEMNHNESEGWESKGFDEKFIPIILNRMNEEEYYQTRIDAFKKIFLKIDVDFAEYFVEGNSIIEEIFSLIYLGDMISWYLAILQNVNPTTIEFINFLKEEIS